MCIYFHSQTRFKPFCNVWLSFFTGASSCVIASISDSPWGSGLGPILAFHPLSSSWLISPTAVFLVASSTQKICLWASQAQLMLRGISYLPHLPCVTILGFPSWSTVSSFAKLTRLETSESSSTPPCSLFHPSS